MSYYHGKNGVVKVNDHSLCVNSFSFEHTITENESTSTCSGGKYECGGGIEKITGEFTAKYPTVDGPFGSTLGLKAGAFVELELALATTTSAPKATIPTAFIQSVSPSVDVNDWINYNCKFTSSGAFTLPSA